MLVVPSAITEQCSIYLKPIVTNTPSAILGLTILLRTIFASDHVEDLVKGWLQIENFLFVENLIELSSTFT